MANEVTSTLNFFGLQPPRLPRPDSPFDCLWRDTRNLISQMKLLPAILRPFRADRQLDELYLRRWSIFYLLYFTICSIGQVLIIPPVLIITLAATAAVTFLVRIHSLIVWRWVQGDPFQVYPESLSTTQRYNHQYRWIYINGIATTEKTMAQELAYLHQLFHDPIVGVNNRTYGFLGDIFECIIQRSFNFHTKETRLAFELTKSYLLQDTSSVSKVILIAHSQGGILASHVLDSLLLDSEISPSHLAKLEIYTFGSAALTVNNPFINAKRTERMVKVIEHYCNEEDMVTSWGALSSGMAGKTNGVQMRHLQKAESIDLPFMGKIFIRKGQTGHLLNQHYLKPMFAEIKKIGTDSKTTEYLDCVVKRVNGSNNTGSCGGVPLEGDARYIVEPRNADIHTGEQSVRDVSKLVTYMKVARHRV